MANVQRFQPQVNAQSIPIDIQLSRLLEWLLTRHHCKKDWPEKIAIIRKKMNEAIKDMPEDQRIVKILIESSPLNYYNVKRIVEVLKETEQDSKNIFGMYGSQRMKDWQEILKWYQKDNLYLAESASILSRNAIYEIPAIKRLINKLDVNSRNEITKKKANCNKLFQDYQEKFLSKCQQFGIINIEINNIQNKTLQKIQEMLINELTNEMKTELPKIFQNITSTIQNNLRAPLLYYHSFMIYFNNHFKQSTNNDDNKTIYGGLSLLSTIIEKGNVTTYEWKHGEAPLKIEAPVEETILNEDNENEDEINFDVELETGDIDWGESLIVAEEGQETIDFSTIDEYSAPIQGITIEQDGIEGGIAKGEDALSILENSNTRYMMIDEIYELEGFLSQRLEEEKRSNANEMNELSTGGRGDSKADINMLNLMNESSFNNVDLSEIKTFHHNTLQLMGLFNENKTKQFLLIRESSRFVRRLATSIEENIKLSRKMEAIQEECDTKLKEIDSEVDQLKPKVQNLTRQSKELQNELSKDISTKYNNRNVFISGGSL